MKGKEFLTEAIALNMPDLEAVRIKCLCQVNTETAKTEINTKPRRKFRARKFIVSLIAAVLMFCMSFTVLGATIPAFNEWIASFSPELAGFLGQYITDDISNIIRPVENMKVVSDGIEVAVVGVVSDGENAWVMLTIKDVEDQELASKVGSEGLYLMTERGPFDTFYNKELDCYAVIMKLYGLDPQKNVIDITVTGLRNHDDFFEEKGLSDGTWAFSIPTEHQARKVVECAAKATGWEISPETGNYTYGPAAISRIILSPIAVTFESDFCIMGGINDIYLLMRDGSEILISNNHRQNVDEGGAYNGPGNPKPDDEDETKAFAGGSMFLKDNIWINTYNPGVIAWNNEYPFKDDVIDIKNVVAIIINGQRINL